MAYTTKVDRSLCTSISSCVAIASNTFELDGEGIAVVKKQNGDADDLILQAAKSCPTNAVLVYDESGKKIWPES
jgi:ferredoxin